MRSVGIASEGRLFDNTHFIDSLEIEVNDLSKSLAVKTLNNLRNI